jgi:Na+-transporting methylmalonyl-CoA/oxaloacetate decarboxylase gamma subunit
LLLLHLLLHLLQLMSERMRSMFVHAHSVPTPSPCLSRDEHIHRVKAILGAHLLHCWQVVRARPCSQMLVPLQFLSLVDADAAAAAIVAHATLSAM